MSGDFEMGEGKEEGLNANGGRGRRNEGGEGSAGSMDKKQLGAPPANDNCCIA